MNKSHIVEGVTVKTLLSLIPRDNIVSRKKENVRRGKNLINFTEIVKNLGT